jgi:hypothetical protein
MAFQEPAELEVRFLFFIIYFKVAVCHATMAGSGLEIMKKEMNLHRTCRSSGSKVSEDQPQQQVAAAARTKRLQREQREALSILLLLLLLLPFFLAS